jgi:methylmalonyl-CoA/ethylmalonyl-CoA epimerase
MSYQDPTSEFLSLKDGVWQIALLVPDLDKAVETYWKMFGIGPWHIYTYGKPFVKRMTFRGKPGDYKMRLALARTGPMQIELIEPLEGDSIYAEFVQERGYGLHHIAILVEDIEEAVARAKAAGLEVLMDGGGYGLDGDGAYAYLDTEAVIGTTLELIELPKRRAQPEKVYPPADA